MITIPEGWRIAQFEEDENKENINPPIQQMPQQEEQQNINPPQEEKKEASDTLPPQEASNQGDIYSPILEKIKSNYAYKMYIERIIEQKSNIEDLKKRIKKGGDPDGYLLSRIEKAKKNIQRDLGYINDSEIDKNLLFQYLDRESKLYGPKRGMNSSIKTIINTFVDAEVDKYQGKNIDLEWSKKRVRDYMGYVHKYVREICKITGENYENKIEEILKDIKSQAKEKSDFKINFIKYEKEFSERFIEGAKNKNFNISYSTYNDDDIGKTYRLSKKVAQHEVSFDILYDDMSNSREIIFAVDGSYEVNPNMSDKAKLGIAISIKRAFDLVLSNYKNSNIVFTAGAYSGDGKKEYRQKAYMDMGFGPPDSVGRMRGRIVDGKMVPIMPDKLSEEEEDQDLDDELDEDFSEEEKDILSAIYKILFLQDLNEEKNND